MIANPKVQSISVKDLIERGLIVAPTKVFGSHGGKIIQATLKKDGTFIYSKEVYASPSVAAGRGITAELGMSTPGRTYASVNGWKFWQVRCPDGTSRSLADIREQMRSHPKKPRG